MVAVLNVKKGADFSITVSMECTCIDCTYQVEEVEDDNFICKNRSTNHLHTNRIIGWATKRGKISKVGKYMQYEQNENKSGNFGVY